MDRFTELAVFVAAVEEGSIAAAARKLGLSAVMAGRYLASLEQRVAARLVERTTQRLSLTDAGQKYMTSSKHILEAWTEANREAADIQSNPTGTLRIAAPVTFGTLYLGPLIAQFLADFPAVNITLQLQDRFIDLVEDGIDLALRIGHLSDSELIARKIADCPLLACATPAYLAVAGAPATPAELHSHTLIGYLGNHNAAPWHFYDDKQGWIQADDKRRFLANNTAIMLEVALAHAGIAYGPAFVFNRHLSSGELVQVLPAWACPTLPMHAITPNAKYVNTKTRLFIERLKTTFASNSEN
ncbi:MAG: LysR family transcriptional regulator [Pantoea sp.]|uniref:LysR family transcriptional regulator n=1 Tax=Pantoea sp. TaxID=69393 RepID=UPI002388E96D|nr:LysR family transcriptional regulator [Pantoea sp.]MDE1187003.1 LysR family transcriptional regulator [Pantoea sp.]